MHIHTRLGQVFKDDGPIYDHPSVTIFASNREVSLRRVADSSVKPLDVFRIPPLVHLSVSPVMSGSGAPVTSLKIVYLNLTQYRLNFKLQSGARLSSWIAFSKDILVYYHSPLSLP